MIAASSRGARRTSLVSGHPAEGHFHLAAWDGRSHPSSPPLAQVAGPAAPSAGQESGIGRRPARSLEAPAGPGQAPDAPPQALRALSHRLEPRPPPPTTCWAAPRSQARPPRLPRRPGLTLQGAVPHASRSRRQPTRPTCCTPSRGFTRSHTNHWRHGGRGGRKGGGRTTQARKARSAQRTHGARQQ